MMVSDIDWPAHVDRTPASEREKTYKFSANLGETLDRIEREIELIGADEYRFSTGASQRQSDNRPYANRSPDDPGIVLYWTMPDQDAGDADDGWSHAAAVDEYTKLRDNARALYLWLKEKRKMNQRPVKTGRSEFASARLPPGADSDDVIAVGPSSPLNGREPHDVLDVDADAPEDVVRAAAKALKKKHHPDAGGDEDRFKAIVAAEEAMLDG